LKRKVSAFSKVSPKNLQKAVIQIIKTNHQQCKCFLEVLVYRSLWFPASLIITNQVANQIALSLASFTFMFAMACSNH
jgi:MATE family multidrug resistance protein